MKSTVKRNLLVAPILFAAMIGWSHGAQAQSPAHPTMTLEAAVAVYVEGRALQTRHDHAGAVAAYLQAAEAGYPPAQRRLGELYDHGTPAVPRDYQESLRWYELARNGGEDIPKIKPRMTGQPVD